MRLALQTRTGAHTHTRSCSCGSVMRQQHTGTLMRSVQQCDMPFIPTRKSVSHCTYLLTHVASKHIYHIATHMQRPCLLAHTHTHRHTCARERAHTCMVTHVHGHKHTHGHTHAWSHMCTTQPGIGSICSRHAQRDCVPGLVLLGAGLKNSRADRMALSLSAFSTAATASRRSLHVRACVHA